MQSSIDRVFDRKFENSENWNILESIDKFISNLKKKNKNWTMEARAIQIVKSNDHIFEVDLENLKQILGADDIKDRYVVVISIAGALRTGKSFLLNFMLKYLRAKVSVEKKRIHLMKHRFLSILLTKIYHRLEIGRRFAKK